MDIRKIKKLIELLEESELTELEISEGEESIRLSRRPPALASISPPLPQHDLKSAPNESAAYSSDLDAIDKRPEEAIGVISPMVGTFYASPNPESPAYVKIGDEVMAGDTLCVIEAMKIFNHVEAEHTGIVRKILKDSGDPVEFGEVLFMIEASTLENNP